MRESHISTKFGEELEALRNEVMLMGGQVERQLKDAVRIFIAGDELLHQQLHRVERKVNEREKKIDSVCIKVIARRQPAAGDLRMVYCVLKIVHDLERIGDEACKIAAHGEKMRAAGPVEGSMFVDIRALSSRVSDHLREALDAFSREDFKPAYEAALGDRETDTELQAIEHRLLAALPAAGDQSIGLVCQFVVIRSLERVLQHARNIAEYVIFLANGEDVRHSYRAGDNKG
jgi:phosphate transport system protein